MYENAGGSFRKQMELVSSHGIFVAPHGAGLMNLLYMPPLSAVVELFPYTLDHNLYSSLAVLMGVANYPVHAIEGHTVWATDLVRACDLTSHRRALLDRQHHPSYPCQCSVETCCWCQCARGG